MVYRGHVANGIIQLEGSVILPEGAEVRVELATDPTDEEFRVSIEQKLDRLASLPANWDCEGRRELTQQSFAPRVISLRDCRPTSHRFPRWFRRRQGICNSSGTPAADRSNWKSKTPRRSTTSNGIRTKKLKKKTFSTSKIPIAQYI